MNDFYTYAYLRMNGTPYYVGKGRNNRYKSANHKVNVPKDENRILFLKRHLTEEQAFIHEKYMIAVLGKKVDGGLLHNITDGGEGPSGLKHSSETKRRIGDAKRGRSLSEEHKEKLRRQKIGNTWNQGRVVPQEQKDKEIHGFTLDFLIVFSSTWV